MKVLVVTNMYPTESQPHFGVFVQEQVASLREIGAEVDVLFVNGRQGKLNYLLGFARLWRRLLRKDYDLIHAHYVFSGLIALAQPKVPVVLTHHGPEVFMTWEATICRWFTRFFDAVIVVSSEMKRRLPCERAYVIPCGIALADFQPLPRDEARNELGLPLDRKLVLWAGEPQRPEKRYELVEQAYGLVSHRRPDVDLVTLSGKPHDVVPTYMNAADVLVLTSDAEGSPMVIKEAMACNLPIVSTAVGDVADVIGGTEGCYVSSQDPSDIAAQLEKALDFGRRTNGRMAVQDLDLKAIGRRVLNVYEQTLSAKKKTRKTAAAIAEKTEPS